MTQRVEHIGDATLYLGDWRSIDRAFLQADAVVSDPPYGINFTQSGKHGRRFGGVGGTRAARERGTPQIIGDDGPFDPLPLAELATNTILWGADHFYPRLPDCGRWLAWNKLGDMEPWDSFSDVEFAWHSIEGAARIFSMKWKGIACDKKGENNGLREHPMQKPIRLMEWCVGMSAGTVLDPYMGSGSTGVACANLQRPFVGAEIEPRWFDIACRRIEQAYKQPRLFAEPAPKIVQPSMFDATGGDDGR
jgi:site-specific DNA-methyltransferase (adenine-specific)